VWLIAAGSPEESALPSPSRSTPPTEQRPNGVLEGVLAGIGFGGLFFSLDRAGDGAGLWPVAAGQAGALAVLLVALAAAALLGRPVRPAPAGSADPAGTSWLMVAVGSVVLAIIANAAFFWSTTAGLLTVAAVLTSLYPAATVGLARLVLHERIARRQGLGLALAGVAVVLITLG